MQPSICAVAFQCNSYLTTLTLANLRPAYPPKLYETSQTESSEIGLISSRNRLRHLASAARPSSVRGHQ
jgi:hypothetical protein